MSFDFDLYVIGAGSGGVRCARWSAGLGAKVAICEEDRFGGTCVIRGCVPKKLMVYASEVSHEVAAAKNFGWNIKSTEFNWSTLKANRDKEIDRLTGLYQKMLDKNNVTIHRGKGKLIDAHTVEVNGERFTAEKILISTGGWPNLPKVEGIEHVMTSNEVFTSESQPESILIVGGGYIACEFACVYKGLGSEVHQFIRSDLILRAFDYDLREFLQEEMIKKGININHSTNVKRIEKEGKKFIVTYESNGKEDVKIFDAVLYATGRNPNTKNIGLEDTGVKLGDKGAIIVDKTYKTNIDSIYAVGDCIDHVNLTPVATVQGTLLAESWFNNNSYQMSYENIPSAVFTQPPLATVGMSEEEAKKQGHEYDVYTSNFKALKHTVSGIDERTFMKMIVDLKTDKILGLHMVGKDSAEIMQGMAIAINAGATKANFDKTVGIHPSSAEEFVTMRNKRN